MFYYFCLFFLCRNDHSDSIIEDMDIADSPVKTREVSPCKKLGSHSDSEKYCYNRDSYCNNEPDGVDNDDEDDARLDIRNEGTEQDPCHLASLWARSNEIDGDSGSDVSTDLIHPPTSR